LKKPRSKILVVFAKGSPYFLDDFEGRRIGFRPHGCGQEGKEDKLLKIQRAFFGFGGFFNDAVDKPDILIGKEDIFDVVFEILFLNGTDDFGVHFHFGK
jgi:hypothetical protein